MGIISSLANLFGYVLNWLYNILNNYGIAIIVFSIMLRILLIPITIKQQRTMKKSSKLQVQMKELQNKYKNNPEKLNQETIELYKKEKMSPFSGCLSSILQILIILSVFYVVSKPLTYMKKIDKEVIDNYVNEIKAENSTASTYYEIDVVQKKAAEDPQVNINMDFFGLDLSKVPNQNLKDLKVYIIPILYVITSFISIKMTNNMQSNINKDKKDEKTVENDLENSDKPKDSSEEALESMQDMTKTMSFMMPIMSIFIAFIAPLGLALYWLVSNILMTIERLIIDKITNKQKEDKDKPIEVEAKVEEK